MRDEDRLFLKHQPILVEIANKPAIKNLLGIPLDKQVLGLNPYGYSYKIGLNKGVAVVSTEMVIAQKLQGALIILEESDRMIVDKMRRDSYGGLNWIFLSSPQTITASAGSNVIYNVQNTWADVRAGSPNAPALTTFFVDTYNNGALYELARAFLFFALTTVVSANSNILDGTKITIPAVSNFSNTLGGTIYATSHTNNDPITASAANFANIGSEKTWGSVTVANISTSTTSDITLTATARANIFGGQVNKIGLRHGHDIDNTAPVNQNDQANKDVTTFTLTVVYTAPAGYMV